MAAANHLGHIRRLLTTLGVVLGSGRLVTVASADGVVLPRSINAVRWVGKTLRQLPADARLPAQGQLAHRSSR